MASGKNINIFLIDGTAAGRKKCSLSNWTGLVYKIPRKLVAECDDIKEMKHNGIYFLIGINEDTGHNSVYIGQARQRSNGNGLMGRITEPHNSITFWKEVVLVTTINDYFGPTELCYLENRFYKLAKEANQYFVTNGNTPSEGNPTEEKKCELDEFIEFAKLLIENIGYNFLIPMVLQNSPIVTMDYNGANANGTYTENGSVIVFKGSMINPDATSTCPKSVIKLREIYSDKIVDNVLKEDLEFKSPSGAACFVAGASVNGNVYWKNEGGKTIKELLNI